MGIRALVRRAMHRLGFGPQPAARQRYIGPDGASAGPVGGEPLPFESVCWVSRHGLAKAGVVCPKCNALAAKPGEYGLIMQTHRGEAIPCYGCKSVLLASPNDDEGDPKRGQPLDPKVHFIFASRVQRPASRKVKRISNAPIGLQTWVVIQPSFPKLPDGRTVNNEEGRVIAIVGTTATVALGGNEGLGGNAGYGGDLVPIDLKHLRAMILPTLRSGDPVRIIKGPAEGAYGIISTSTRGEVWVHMAGTADIITFPIEYVEKLEPLEIHPDSGT